MESPSPSPPTSVTKDGVVVTLLESAPWSHIVYVDRETGPLLVPPEAFFDDIDREQPISKSQSQRQHLGEKLFTIGSTSLMMALSGRSFRLKRSGNIRTRKQNRPTGSPQWQATTRPQHRSQCSGANFQEANSSNATFLASHQGRPGTRGLCADAEMLDRALRRNRSLGPLRRKAAHVPGERPLRRRGARPR